MGEEVEEDVPFLEDDDAGAFADFFAGNINDNLRSHSHPSNNIHAFHTEVGSLWQIGGIGGYFRLAGFISSQATPD